jgi:hypothetical protein
MREMSIDENNKRNITPIHSEISRFSIGTILGAYSGAGTLALAMAQRQRVFSSGHLVERAAAVDAVEDRTRFI